MLVTWAGLFPAVSMREANGVVPAGTTLTSLRLPGASCSRASGSATG